MFVVYVYTGHVTWDDALTMGTIGGNVAIYKALQPRGY